MTLKAPPRAPDVNSVSSRSHRRQLAEATARWMETTITCIDSDDFRTLPKSLLLGEHPDADDRRQPKQAAPADTPPYLAALYEFPLLTREQEFHLFRKMNFLRYEAAQVQATLNLSHLNRRSLQKLERFLADAEAVRNQIVQCNLRLVVSIAKTLVDYSSSLDELISEGNLPLIRAVEIFDFTRGLRFSTYATWAVRNGLYRVTRRNRRLQARFRTDEPDWFLAAQSVDPESSTTDYPLDEERLQQLVSQLDDRSQTILRDRFALAGQPRPAKFRELAAKLRLSSERVRQLLERALEQLRSPDGGSEGLRGVQ